MKNNVLKKLFAVSLASLVLVGGLSTTFATTKTEAELAQMVLERENAKLTERGVRELYNSIDDVPNSYAKINSLRAELEAEEAKKKADEEAKKAEAEKKAEEIKQKNAAELENVIDKNEKYLEASKKAEEKLRLEAIEKKAPFYEAKRAEKYAQYLANEAKKELDKNPDKKELIDKYEEAKKNLELAKENKKKAELALNIANVAYEIAKNNTVRYTNEIKVAKDALKALGVIKKNKEAKPEVTEEAKPEVTEEAKPEVTEEAKPEVKKDEVKNRNTVKTSDERNVVAIAGLLSVAGLSVVALRRKSEK